MNEFDRCECGREFDHSNDDNKDDWSIWEDENCNIHWRCPKCQAKILAANVYENKYD